jgi:hypothetical protein
MTLRTHILGWAIVPALLIAACGDDETETNSSTVADAGNVSDTGAAVADSGTDASAVVETGEGPGQFVAEFETSADFFTNMDAALPGSSPHGTQQTWYSTNLQEAIDGGTPFVAGVGSVSIKRFDMMDDGEADGYAIMIRQEDGYFPEGGDWLYEMRMLDGTVMNDPEMGMPMSGPIQMCASCHSAGADTSFLLATRL